MKRALGILFDSEALLDRFRVDLDGFAVAPTAGFSLEVSVGAIGRGLRFHGADKPVLLLNLDIDPESDTFHISKAAWNMSWPGVNAVASWSIRPVRESDVCMAYAPQMNWSTVQFYIDWAKSGRQYACDMNDVYLRLNNGGRGFPWVTPRNRYGAGNRLPLNKYHSSPVPLP